VSGAPPRRRLTPPPIDPTLDTPIASTVHRGRPRNREPSSTVSTWLPAGAHDKLIQLAQEQETSISALVRSLLMLRLR
jgi:hypothetical protein